MPGVGHVSADEGIDLVPRGVYYSHLKHSGKLVKGFSGIGTSEETKSQLGGVLNISAGS